MTDWYDDDTFWSTFRDYMFDATRLELARAEVNHLIALLKLNPDAAVLDLCCGIGRHSLEFARRGFPVTAVDRTTLYLEHARKVAAEERLNVEYVQSDMREFLRREAFDLAISMFTSFGYFDDPGDDLRVAGNICKSLRPSGKFVIDVNGKEVIAAKFRARDWNRREDGVIVMEERRVLDGWSSLESRWIYLHGTDRHESTLVLRLYSGDEMSAMLKEAGFAEVKLYGSLTGTPYDNQAERLIAVAQK